MRMRARSIVESEVGEDLLLFNSGNQRFHALNISGKILWSNYYCDREMDRAIDAIKVAFGLSPEDDIKADVETFLVSLEKAELLHSGGGGPADRAEEQTHATTVLLKGRDYIKPSMQEIPLDWLKEKHPSAFLDVMFSDTWGPATDDFR